MLRAQPFREIERLAGCDPATATLTPVDPEVWYTMDTRGPEYTACMDCYDDLDNKPCASSWSWDMTRCTDMMPYLVGGMKATGVFMQTSSLANRQDIVIGSKYMLTFSKCQPGQNCEYEWVVLNARGDGVVHRERGWYNYTRASRYSATDGQGGANLQATIEFEPRESRDLMLGRSAQCGSVNKDDDVHYDSPLTWGSLWQARERFAGSFQSKYGFATFTLSK